MSLQKIVILIVFTLVSFGYIQPVQAVEQYTIKEMTSKVKTALENRRQRFDLFVPLKKRGILGENNKGYISILKENDADEDLVAAENVDRGVIYKTIAEQNNLTDEISTIEKVFARIHRDKAEAGEFIQMEDGSWVLK